MVGSYTDVLHVKPYFYGISYVNGLVVGYLMATQSWSQFRAKHFNAIVKIDNICKIVAITSITLVLLQGGVYGLSTTMSALEAALLSSLFSIPICIKILDDSFSPLARYILTMRVWKPIRDVLRVSYVWHMLVFDLVCHFLPLTNPTILNILVHWTLCYSLSYIVSQIIYRKIETPIIKFSKTISNYI